MNWRKAKPEFVLEEGFMKFLENMEYKRRDDIRDIDSLKNNLKEKLGRLNSTSFSDKEFERILNILEGANEEEAFDNIREKHLLERDNGDAFYFTLVDFNEIQNNSFEIANQISMKGKYRNRYDVTILINGLPLIQIELKKSGVRLKDGFNQIKRYKRHSYSGLFKYIQIFVISNEDITKYFSNSKGELNYQFAFHWTDANNKPYLNLFDFTRVFLKIDHVMEMMSDYMINNKADDSIIILRPYQYYASKGVIEKVLNTPYKDIEVDDVSNNAYIWHSTGSGKTLTSFKVSHTLSKNKNIKKVIFLVDRKDLDTQTTEEFNKFQKGSIDSTSSTRVLMSQLKDDNNNLVLTTIQKMSYAIKGYGKDLKQLQNERIVFVVDECHRSQFGDMQKNIRKFFTKAQFIGFTGTPIFEENASDPAYITDNIFGECIHHYMLKDAISDKNVLPFHIEYMKTFSGGSNIDNVKVEAINEEEVFANEERMNLIVDDIIKNHRLKTNEGKYNAIFATDSIDSAIKYSKIFQKKMLNVDEEKKLKIATIFSYSDNADFTNAHPKEELDLLIESYNQMFDVSFSTDNMDAYRNHISKSMKNADIDILIVVDMFLTGFDAQKLRVLYVDKNMKYHGLLQAFSRTNRILDNGKTSGIVVSYRNMKKDVEDSLKLFNDSDVLDGILVKDLDEYIKDFKAIFAKIKEKSVNGIPDIKSEENKKEFVLNFRELLKTKKSMETFVNFDFNSANLGLTESDFAKYSSFYHELYQDTQNRRPNEVSIIDDLEFYVELLDVDEIDYDYIKKLISNKDKKPGEEVKNNIKKAISQSSSKELYYKKDLILAFLESQFFERSDNPEDDYRDFFDKEMAREFKEFSDETGLTVPQLETEILKITYDPNEEWSKVESSSVVRDYLIENGRPARIRVVSEIVDKLDVFLRNMYMKYFYNENKKDSKLN